MSSLKIEYSKLEKYLKDKKKEYEHDLFELSEEFESSKTYIKGHLHMIDMLLDDLDSFLSYDILGIDLAKNFDFIIQNDYQPKTGGLIPPKPPKSGSNIVKETLPCGCNKNCENCFIAKSMKHKFLEECDSVFDAASDYADFINTCAEINRNS